MEQAQYKRGKDREMQSLAKAQSIQKELFRKIFEYTKH